MSEMWEAWALVALALLAWLWFDSMRSRERAVAACARACERDGLQFLDETVECVSLRPARERHRDARRRGRIAHHGALPVAVSLSAASHAEVDRRNGRRPKALDRDPFHAVREGRGRGIRGRAVRQARARGGGRDGGAAVLVRQRAEGASARVLLRNAPRGAAHAAAVQAGNGRHDLPRAAAGGFPGALRGSRRVGSVADLHGNRRRPVPVDPQDRDAVAALRACGARARGAPCRGADLSRYHGAAAARALRADAPRVLREPRGNAGNPARAHPGGDRGRAPGGRGGRGAFGEDLARDDLRQPGDGDRHGRGAQAPRHEEAPAPRAGSHYGGKLLVRKTAFSVLASAGVLALAACSATRVAYDNADTVIRFMASSYLDLDSAQSEDLRPRIARFHQWHRVNELPAYAALLQSASRRAANGVTAEDVSWGLDNLRARYRGLAAKAAEDAAPVLATLRPAQLAVLERKFAESNEKYAKEFLPADEKKRLRAQGKRMLERLRDFAGELTPEQEARIGGFVAAHERHAALRFEDRQRLQRELVALLEQRREPQELGRQLAEMFTRPEARRSEEFLREDRRWDGDFAQLIADLDRSLSPAQRARVVRRLSGYAEDCAVLAGKKTEAA